LATSTSSKSSTSLVSTITVIASAQGLPTGAKVGISVAIPLMFLIFLVAGVYILSRKRKRAKIVAMYTDNRDNLADMYVKPELEADPPVAATGHEVVKAQPVELPAREYTQTPAPIPESVVRKNRSLFFCHILRPCPFCQWVDD